MRICKIFAYLSLLFSAAPVCAHDHGAVDLEQGPPLSVVTTDELQAVREAGFPFLLVDARGPEAYAVGHLPGAINLPTDKMEEQAPRLPKDRLIVVYCGSLQCPHSRILGQWLVSHGWPLVRHYAEGISGWQQAGYPVEATR